MSCRKISSVQCWLRLSGSPSLLHVMSDSIRSFEDDSSFLVAVWPSQAAFSHLLHRRLSILVRMMVKV